MRGGGEGVSMAQKGEEKAKRRVSGKANDGAERPLAVRRGRVSGIGAGAQMRAVRKDGWTAKRRKLFMETLAVTCNVSESARTVGMNISSAYYLKQRDPGFAREWNHALCIGHEELLALMLRQALFGSEEEEIVLDGEGAVKSRKIKRAYPHALAMGLLKAHAATVAQTRLEDAEVRPDSEDALERLRTALAEVRRRSGAE